MRLLLCCHAFNDLVTKEFLFYISFYVYGIYFSFKRLEHKREKKCKIRAKGRQL